MSSTEIAPAPVGQFDLSPKSFEQALQLAEYLADSTMVPKDFVGKPGNCLIAMQWGLEVGLKPLQAMQNIAVINGRPSMWGDAVLALVRSSPLCEYVIETDDGHTATCRAKRRGEPEQISTFDMNDAKTAGLLSKAGPWTQYPKRMRQMRARSFRLRDSFPDVLKGMAVTEELLDMRKDMGMADEVGAPPPPPAPPPSKTDLPDYPQKDFDANLPAWRGVIESGRKTPEALIAMLSTKGVLSETQKDAIKKLAPIENGAGSAAGPSATDATTEGAGK